MSIPIKKPGVRPGDPLKAGLHQAVIVEIKDLGVQPDPFNAGKTKHQVIAIFKDASGDQAARFYTPSFHEKAKLTIDLKSVFNEQIPETIKTMEDLVGLQCQILTVQKKNTKGYTSAQVKSVLPPVAGQNVVPVEKVGTAQTPESDDSEIPF